jgi:hypothetical protein
MIPAGSGDFTVLTEEILTANGLEKALYRLTSAAVSTFDRVMHASLTITDEGLRTWAPTSRTAVTCDFLQYQLREGPCFEVATEHPLVVAIDLAHDERWPAWGPRAAELGVRSQAAHRLYVEGKGRMAALNLYSDRVGAVEADPMLLELFAAQVALVFGFGRRVQQLNDALASRTVIGEAIGMVMQRFGLDERAAFAYLKRQSQDENRKLRDVCTDMVAQGGPG